MSVTSVDEAKAFLYGQPGDSFVADRDALTKQVRAAGNRELANEVKALRKPSAVAAEVNRVVRADPDGIALILQAAELLRDAQQGALDGSTINAAELQQQYRAAIRALAQGAQTKKAEVRAALEAATIDLASNDDLRIGALVVVPTPESIFGPSPQVQSAETAPEPNAESLPQDELATRRAKRQKADANKAVEEAAAEAAVEAKAAIQDANAQAAAEQEQHERAKEAAAEAEAKAQAAAEQEQRERAKEAARLHKQRKKEIAKQHRDAVRAHLKALDAEDAASTAIETAEQEIIDTDVRLQAMQQALDDAQQQQLDAQAARDAAEQTQRQLHEASSAAEAVVDALADELDALEDLDAD